MKRIYAVTGAFGHLGNTLVRSLLKPGEKVRALALPGETCPQLENRDPSQLEIVRGDIRDPEAMDAFFAGRRGRGLCGAYCRDRQHHVPNGSQAV